MSSGSVSREPTVDIWFANVDDGLLVRWLIHTDGQSVLPNDPGERNLPIISIPLLWISYCYSWSKGKLTGYIQLVLLFTSNTPVSLASPRGSLLSLPSTFSVSFWSQYGQFLQIAFVSTCYNLRFLSILLTSPLRLDSLCNFPLGGSFNFGLMPGDILGWTEKTKQSLHLRPYSMWNSVCVRCDNSGYF